MDYSVPANFGGAALQQADLDDYRRRLYEKSPTPQDAMRFADLKMRLCRRLSHKDVAIYDKSIQVLKQTPPAATETRVMAEAVIKIIETRALASDPVKVSEQRSRKERITGLRVSLVSDKTKRGTVLPENGLLNIFDGGGKCFSVQIDDEPSSRSFSRTDLDLLCFYCQDEVASPLCSIIVASFKS